MGTTKLLRKPNKLHGGNLQWTGIPSRGSRNTRSRMMLQKLRYSFSSYEPVMAPRLDTSSLEQVNNSQNLPGILD